MRKLKITEELLYTAVYRLLDVPELLVISLTDIFRIRAVRAMGIIADWFEDRFGLECPSVELSDRINR